MATQNTPQTVTHSCAICGHDVEVVVGKRGRPRWYHPECAELQKALNRVVDLLGEGAKVGGEKRAVRFKTPQHAKKTRSLMFSTLNTATNKIVLADYYARNELIPLDEGDDQ